MKHGGGPVWLRGFFAGSDPGDFEPVQGTTKSQDYQGTLKYNIKPSVEKLSFSVIGPVSADTEPVDSFPHTWLSMRDTRKLDIMQKFTNNVAYLFFTITPKARFSQTSDLCLYHCPVSQRNKLIDFKGSNLCIYSV